MVIEYIDEHHLLNRNYKYLVALSGGADSVALLRLLLDMEYNIEAAHCNFNLRGLESDRDEKFVRQLCEKHCVPLHIAHFATREYASLHKISIEMAARTLRYSWFEQLRNDINAAGICVAHHRDDSVETVLMNLLRGTGIHGLTGISAKNGDVLRPLLCVSRKQIEDYLHSIGQDYVDDSTNFVADVVRNKIRLNVIPALCNVNPNASEAIAGTAERLAEAAKMFDYAIAAAIEKVKSTTERGISIDIDRLRAQPSPEYILFEILKNYHFSPSQIAQIYQQTTSSCSGQTFSSADYDALFDRGRVLVEPLYVAPKPLRIMEEGVYVHENMRVKVEKIVCDGAFRLSKSNDCAMLDYDKVAFPLVIRPVKDGERFKPFGMNGTKLVSDYLTDKKKSLFDKRRQLVVADAKDRLMWLIKERPDNDFSIESSTERVLSITIS